jgi:hypothetical protein
VYKRQVKILDINGKCIFETTCDISYGIKIDASSWPAGAFFVQIDLEGKKYLYLAEKL